jgi:hypothetical protein
MKNSLLIIAILTMLCFQSMAQQIPNGSFETWTNGEPDNWNTTNKISVFVFNTVTKETADPEQGLASAKLTVVTQAIPFVGTYSIPGLLTLGNLNVDLAAKTFSLTKGFPFTGNPKKLTGYFKYQPVNNDRCIFGVGFFKRNNGIQDTLGYGAIDTAGTFNAWTSFEVPIQYIKTGAPDTMNIVILNTDPLDGLDHTGTRLWVDNLMFDYGNVGIDVATTSKDLSIYAGRDTRQIILTSNFQKQEALDISLFNMSGIETGHWKRNMQQSTEMLDVNNLPQGTYVIRISAGARLIDSRKITILK